MNRLGESNRIRDASLSQAFPFHLTLRKTCIDASTAAIQGNLAYNKTTPPVGLYLGSYGDLSGAGVFYERGTPVHGLVANKDTHRI